MVANITIRPTKLLNLISLPNWATELLLSLAQEQNLVASGNWAWVFLRNHVIQKATYSFIHCQTCKSDYFTQSSEQWKKAPLKNTTQSTVRTQTCLVNYLCT